jgi:hypothetical protein
MAESLKYVVLLAQGALLLFLYMTTHGCRHRGSNAMALPQVLQGFAKREVSFFRNQHESTGFA